MAAKGRWEHEGPFFIKQPHESIRGVAQKKKNSVVKVNTSTDTLPFIWPYEWRYVVEARPNWYLNVSRTMAPPGCIPGEAFSVPGLFTDLKLKRNILSTIFRLLTMKICFQGGSLHMVLLLHRQIIGGMWMVQRQGCVEVTVVRPFKYSLTILVLHVEINLG